MRAASVLLAYVIGVALALADSPVDPRPPSSQATALQQALNAAIARGDEFFQLPKGDIYFNDAPFEIAQASRMVVSGVSNGDTTLWFTPRSPGLVVNTSDTVTVSNLIIDLDPLPYVYGTVIKVSSHTGVGAGSSSQVTVKLDDASITFDELVSTYPPRDTWPPVMAFSRGTNQMQCGGCAWGRAPSGKLVGNRTYEMSLCPSGQQVGNTFAAPTRYGTTYLVFNSSNVLTQSVTLRASSYMAVVEAKGGGGHTYRNLTIASSRPVAPLAANADAFHSTGCSRGPVVEYSTIHISNDDFFNVHNTLQLGAKPNNTASPSSLYIVDVQLFQGPRNSNYGTFLTLPEVKPGFVISLFAVNALDVPLGSLEVTSITRLPDSTSSGVAQSAEQYLSKNGKGCPLSACGGGLKSFGVAQVYEVTFAQPLPPSLPDYFLANVDDFSNTGAIFQFNNFNQTSCNVGRFKSTGGIIRNNTFSNFCLANLEVGALQNYLEGMAHIVDVAITGNTFHGVSSSPIHEFQSGVQASDNSFEP